MNPRIEYKEKIVTKVQERVRILTKIRISPDGTKETTIENVSSRDTVVDRESTKLCDKKSWTIFTTATTDTFPNVKATYGLGITKDVLLGINAGLYVNTKKEFGLALSYSF